MTQGLAQCTTGGKTAPRLYLGGPRTRKTAWLCASASASARRIRFTLQTLVASRILGSSRARKQMPPRGSICVWRNVRRIVRSGGTARSGCGRLLAGKREGRRRRPRCARFQRKILQKYPVGGRSWKRTCFSRQALPCSSFLILSVWRICSAASAWGWRWAFCRESAGSRAWRCCCRSPTTSMRRLPSRCCWAWARPPPPPIRSPRSCSARPATRHRRRPRSTAIR